MSTRERKTKRSIPPRLDPVLPLTAGSGINRDLREGEGAAILKNDNIVAGLGMTYRAFWHAWEMAEIRAAQNYPRYVGGPMDHIAQTFLELVVWFRQQAHPDKPIRVFSEEKAKKARAYWEKEDKRLAAEAKAKKEKGKKGEAEEAAPEKPKKKRCKAEKKGVRCKGPLDHSGKHKGITSKGKKVSWE